MENPESLGELFPQAKLLHFFLSLDVYWLFIVGLLGMVLRIAGCCLLSIPPSLLQY